MGRRKYALATRRRRDAVIERLRGDAAGPRVVLRSSDLDFYLSGRLVPLHAPDGGAAIRRCRHHLGALTGTEDTARPFVGKPKTHGGVLDRVARFIGNQHCKPACSPRAGGIDRPVTF